MKRLNKAQSYGLIAMIAGYALHLAIVIPFPDATILGTLAWGVAFAGAGVYAVATFPSVTTWLRKILRGGTG